MREILLSVALILFKQPGKEVSILSTGRRQMRFHHVTIKDVPVSGRHGDTARIGTARSGTVPTRPDTVRHIPAWRGLAWQIEVRGLANRSEGLGAGPCL